MQNRPPYFVDFNEQNLRRSLTASLPETYRPEIKLEVIDLAVQATKRAERSFFDTLELASDEDVAQRVLLVALSVARQTFDHMLKEAIAYSREQGIKVKVRRTKRQ
jgi:hypothetical protein